MRRHDATVTLIWLLTMSGTAVLLFLSKMTVRRDSNELRDAKSALIDDFFDYAEGR